MPAKKTPVAKKDVPASPDNKIDQDFPNFPGYPGKEEIISPESATEKEVADVDNKDGEKRDYKRKNTDELQSDGSANAFEKTEGEAGLNKKDTSPGDNY